MAGLASPLTRHCGFFGDFLPGWTGRAAINHGAPVEGWQAGVCDPTGIRGEGPLSQAQVPPAGRCSAGKPRARTPPPHPVPTQRDPPWDGSVPFAGPESPQAMS